MAEYKNIMKYEILDFGRTYHIFNCGNNKENLFLEEDNYFYFLELYDRHLSPYFDTYCYCLLLNHFHFLIRVKEEREIIDKPKTSKVSKTFEVWQPLSNFFNAYAKAFNKKYNRSGSLFQYKFKRKEIKTEKYFYNLVHYIHANPEKHGFVDDFRSYKFSSYQAIISKKPTKIKRDKVIEWYDDLNNFIFCHSREVDEELIKDYMIED
jgi:putative transposase